MNFIKWLLDLVDELLINFFHDPEDDPKTLPMNQEPVARRPIEWELAKVLPADKLKITAMAWIGKDASPKNRAPQELSCAEGVVNLVNMTWPGTLDESIVGTDALFSALKRSKRFHAVLDPVPGCIEISPRTATVNGHVGIYTGPDTIASNDSRDGKFKNNYTRQSWRSTFIIGRGLKAYLFVPVD